MAFNRTIVELKLFSVSCVPTNTDPFNRTIVELKQASEIAASPISN